jgi:hypothetical protein
MIAEKRGKPMSDLQDDSSRLHINATWPPKGRARRTVLGIAAATAAAGTVMVLSAAGGSSVAGADPNSVTLCHRTDSNTNPYVVITVSSRSIQHKIFGPNGHGTHTGPVWNPTLKAQHIKWGDIIPPFDYGKNGQSHYPGLNWPDGQVIFDAGCTVVAPPTSTPPTTPVTTPTTPETTPTTPVTTPTTPVTTPTTPTHSNSGVTSHRNTPATHTPAAHSTAATSNGPIPQGVSAGLHTPIANAGLKAWGIVLMLLGGAAGLLAGLWPTRRRAH